MPRKWNINWKKIAEFEVSVLYVFFCCIWFLPTKQRICFRNCFGSRKNNEIGFEIVSYLLFWTSNAFDEVIVEIKLSFLLVGL